MSYWDGEGRVATLVKLWAEGLSASQIAQRMGAPSRNSVISKVWRMQLAGRKTTIRYNKVTKRRVTKRGPQPKMFTRKSKVAELLASLPTEPLPQYEELIIPQAERKTIETLEKHDCRWPIGDPQEPDFHFCNRKQVVGLPYCEFHARRAFQPPIPRRSPSHPSAQGKETVGGERERETVG